MKRIISLLILCFAFVFSLPAQNIILVQSDKLIPAQSVKLSGTLADRFNSSYKNRILAQDYNRLVESFRNRTEANCWQSEFWGKWFTSAVLAYKYRPEPELKNILNKAVNGLISTQSPDGYIGNYKDERHLEAWDIWGRKYCMLGLIAYFDLTKEKKALDAAVKVADHLIKELADRKVLIVKKGSHRGMAASSVLEPICLLYTRTGEKRYLDFAQEIIRQWETSEGPQLISKAGTDVSQRFPKPKTSWYGWEQGQKAYEMMSCYEGLLELYRITGNPEFRSAVEKTWKNILDKEINIAGSGSSVECWFGGKNLQPLHIDHYQETCVTATWIKLNQQLLRLTGESKYADAIEHSFYNALLGAMSEDGSSWSKYLPLTGVRMKGVEQCGMGLDCCIASGPRGLFTLPLTAVMSGREGININFFIRGNYKLLSPEGRNIEVVQDTDYPQTGEIKIIFSLQQEEHLNVNVRIPSWSTKTSLYVNNEQIKSVNPGEFAQISRTWKSGDEIKLVLDMRGRVEYIGNSPGNIAIVRGPVVLARDSRLGPPHIDATVKPVVGKDGFVDLIPAGINQNKIWMRYKAKFNVVTNNEGDDKPVEVTLCDYSSAGNTLDEKSWFRVWLPQSFDPTKQ